MRTVPVRHACQEAAITFDPSESAALEPAVAADAALAPSTWIVAVGASAGGLEALQRFFSAVQRPTQAAFVVIQHLSPDHRSMMGELLARYTALPVQEAVAGEALVADRIYLMPPGVLMTIDHDQLQFEPRPLHGVSLPIDLFFRSLAASMPERSIGVVLSGSGSDGSAGASVLRAAGGYVMAQLPETAKFDSMPRSVAAAVAVDAILPPEDLALKALAFSRGQAGRLLTGEMVSLPHVKPALQRLFELLLHHAGVDFAQYKLPTVMRRIERRMALLSCASVSDYADRVAASVDECELLRRELLIPVTEFFRDPPAFAALGELLRSQLRQHPPQQPFRIWSAACATGEEAYSLAMLAMEACQAVQCWPGIKVFATDLDPRVLATASAGSYPLGVADGLSPERQAQFFTRENEHLVVRPELRQMVLFAKHNLLEDAPFTRMDVVVCRNALIYFQTDAQERVMRRLQYAINGHGLLFLGRSETLGVLQSDFQTVDSAQKIYRLVRPVLTSVAVRDGFGRSTTSLRAARLHDRPHGLPRAAGASAVEAGQRALLDAYLPLSMLVTAHRQMVHAWGPTERYLRVPSGQANLDALRMLPPRLASVAGHVMQRALREPGQHAAEPLWIELGDERVRVRVVARDVPGEDGADPCVLLSFEELPGAADTVGRSAVDSESERILELERELSETRLTLQASVEELESSVEELQATNEELMSSNEELQSTNEELQSVNEELYTVNAEYNAKLDQVRALHADLDGMSQATGIATLFVDHELKLVRFTPEATLMFHLRATDIGRPIIDFKPQIDYPDLLNDLRVALQSTRPIEREIKGPGTTRYLVRVVGYGEPADAGRRVVLSVIDVSRLHDAERLQSLIDALPEHMAMLNANGTITQVNAAWSAFSQCNGGRDDSAATGVGANYLATLARASNPEAPDLLRRLQQVLSGQAGELQVTYPCHGPAEKRWFVMQVTGLAHTVADSDRAAVVTHRDITPWVGPDGPEGDSHA